MERGKGSRPATKSACPECVKLGRTSPLGNKWKKVWCNAHYREEILNETKTKIKYEYQENLTILSS